MKKCPKCNIIKSLISFSIDSSSRTKRQTYCKKCHYIIEKATKLARINTGLCSRNCGKVLFSKNLCKDHQQGASLLSKAKNRQYRINAIRHYGNKCNCCGETQYEFLTFDHINNDGAVHRRNMGNDGKAFALWLIKNHYPDSIQILCWNCNCAKGYWGRCPHEA